MIILLDSTPLSLLTNAKAPPITVAVLQWARDMRVAGHSLLVPAVADYEVRRELERSNKVRSIIRLDGWSGEYLPLTESAIKLAAKLWAQVRNSGLTTADPKELDGDVLTLRITKIAQTLTEGLYAVCVGGRGKPLQKPDAGYFVELLRLGAEAGGQRNS